MPTVRHPVRRAARRVASAAAVVGGVLFVQARPAFAQGTSTAVGMRYEHPTTDANYGGYYVGPNVATMFPPTGNPGQARTITVFCVDFQNEVTFGQTWAANVSSLAEAPISLALTREPTGLAGYRKAVWLADQFSTQAPEYWGGIQSAIWAIFGAPGFDGNPVKNAQQQPVATDAHNAAYWTAQANTFASSAAFATYDYSGWAVITGTGAAGQQVGGGPQEFIGRVTAVPEPGTLALVAIGGGGLVVAVRRRRRTSRD